MNLTNEEIRGLKEIIRRFRVTNGLNKLVSTDNSITFTSNGCHITDLSATGGGGIQSIVEGDNITVDNTDPLNPIVSATNSSGGDGLQEVTDIGNSTTNNMYINDEISSFSAIELGHFGERGYLSLNTGANEYYGIFGSDDTHQLTSSKNYYLPDNSGTLALSVNGILADNEGNITLGSSYIPPFLKTGGASWSGTGLVYDVTTLEYYFNGDKTTNATQVTLDASDPIDNRLDAIVVDEAGVVSVIKGDASASPISPSVDESHILVQYILVEAGPTQPTIAKEDIYLENVEWTTSTYTTGTATGSIDFDNAVSPKQGVKCISTNADARLGARFVRATSFDPYQYTMLSMWVRFTGSNVATNKSLNVRFENGAGVLVANTINLFNFGLQRNLLNVWQLVVIPITSFGALPTSVKGLKIIMAGGTVGQARQWDIDLISLTDNSVPVINEQVFNVLKDGALVGQSSSLNFKGGAVNVTKDVTGGKIDVEVIGSGGGASLSGLTAATGTNTIDNANYGSEWQWNSLTSGSALKLTSNSTSATTGNTLLELTNSGNTGASVNTFGLKVTNTKASAAGISIGGYFSCNTSGGYALDIDGDSRITAGKSLYYGNASRIYNYAAGSNLTVEAPTSGGLFLISKNTGGVTFGSSTTVVFGSLTNISSTNQSLVFGGDYSGAFRAVGTSTSTIKRETGKLILCANTGLSGGYASFTPNEVLTINGNTTASLSNVGIGTNTPDASAKLEISSTISGFLPPRMTATQASAIASPAKSLMVYVTDTNGTFTSAGLWIYTTSWKLIIAE